MNYSHFTTIDSDCKLADFFNHVMKVLNPLRTLCAPQSFREDPMVSSFQDAKFYEFCRYEVWMHSVVERLAFWIKTIDEYLSDFGGSWKYYAASQRLEYLNEYYGDEDDYNADGTIRVEGLDDKEYKCFSVINDLYDEDFTDIVQDTLPTDMNGICASLIANSQMNMLQGLRKAFGSSVVPYKRNEEGDFCAVSDEEYELSMVSNQVEADDDAQMIKNIATSVQSIIEMFKSCKYNMDNIKILTKARNASANLQNLEFYLIPQVFDGTQSKKG